MRSPEGNELDQAFARTADGAFAAHWEHTIAITAEGPRILTLGRQEIVDLGVPTMAGVS